MRQARRRLCPLNSYKRNYGTREKGATRDFKSIVTKKCSLKAEELRGPIITANHRAIRSTLRNSHPELDELYRPILAIKTKFLFLLKRNLKLYTNKLTVISFIHNHFVTISVMGHEVRTSIICVVRAWRIRRVYVVGVRCLPYHTLRTAPSRNCPSHEGLEKRLRHGLHAQHPSSMVTGTRRQST